MKKLVGILICLAFVAITVGGAYAQFAKPEDAIKYRKSVMQVIKKHFASMAGVVKGKVPFDKSAFVNDANVVAMLSKLPWEASLAPGSAEGDTQLKEKALKNTEEFLAAAKRFEDASRGLAAAAESGDMEAIRKQFGETAQTCGACHKPYRK